MGITKNGEGGQMIRSSGVILVVFTLCLNIGYLRGHQMQTEDETVRNEIKALEAQNASASDAHVLANLIADDYMMIGLDGSMSSKPQVVNAESGTSKPQITLKIQKITSFQGTAIVVGNATISSQAPDGRSGTVEANYSNVWMKRGGTWQLVLSHMSPLHPVPAELCLSQRPTGVN